MMKLCKTESWSIVNKLGVKSTDSFGGATNTFVYPKVLDTVVSSPAPSRE